VNRLRRVAIRGRSHLRMAAGSPIRVRLRRDWTERRRRSGSRTLTGQCGKRRLGAVGGLSIGFGGACLRGRGRCPRRQSPRSTRVGRCLRDLLRLATVAPGRSDMAASPASSRRPGRRRRRPSLAHAPQQAAVGVTIFRAIRAPALLRSRRSTGSTCAVGGSGCSSGPTRNDGPVLSPDGPDGPVPHLA
jgi:hypothetical protein